MESKEQLRVGLSVIAIIASGFFGYQLGSAPRSATVANTTVSEHSGMTMDEMTTGLTGLSGDAFDRAFIEMMIIHHQGAVDMAALIPANAKHEELKKLGQEITTAQMGEIMMMQQWLTDWGYVGANQKADDGRVSGMQH